MTRLHVVLTLLNFVLLVPGVTLPIYSVTITTQVQASIIPEPIEVTVYEQTRSILGTVRELWRSDDHLVSFLILLFSIIVPVTKGSMLLASIYVTKQAVKTWLVRLVDLIGKWSMADVFVVAVFLAFLATRDQAQANTFSVPVLLQQVEVGMQTHLTSTLGPAFYYFLAYCLFSVLWTQVLKHRGSA
ncbi:MAG TPA: paraquat-inducible protein A [Vicinamibacterales bacterium]|nr:paraquat-inducible protein A [Vicinamibacterales bacterium]HJN43291.1 paraquat-inducible protein A [Vicinamibacterales bacterium]